MESLKLLKVYHAFTSMYISDHRLEGIELQMKKQLTRIESSKMEKSNAKHHTSLPKRVTSKVVMARGLG